MKHSSDIIVHTSPGICCASLTVQQMLSQLPIESELNITLWLYELHSVWSQIIQILSKTEESSIDWHIKSYLFKSLSDTEELYFASFYTD